MHFYIMTLFPDMVMNGLNTSITGRAIEKGLLSIDAVNIRDYAYNKHNSVDDYPYGGGAGMLMQAEPVYQTYEAICQKSGKRPRVVYLSPQGRTFCQTMAEEYAREEELVLLCGHYEGIDERVLEEIVTDYVSIGDYVLTGETVEIIENRIYIDGEKLEEDYKTTDIDDVGIANEKIHLAGDEYFVLGDDRQNSEDSRNADVGNVKREYIYGKAWLTISPKKSFGLIR